MLERGERGCLILRRFVEYGIVHLDMEVCASIELYVMINSDI
jgi:hypothetical protein